MESQRVKEFFLKEKMLELHIKGREWAAHGVSLGLFLMKRVPKLSRNFWASVENLPSSDGLLSLKTFCKGFPSRWLSSKESASNSEDLGLIPGLGRSPGEGNGNPLQCSCLENPMDRGAWRATVHRVAKSWTWLKRLSMHTLK